VQATFADCTIVAIDSTGERMQRWRLDDGPELLAGKVDRYGRTVPVFPAGGTSLGGWTVDRTSTGSRVGRIDERVGPYPLLGEGYPIRLEAGSGNLLVLSPWLAAKKDGLLLMRAMARSGASRGSLSIFFSYLDFARQSAGRIPVFAGSPQEFSRDWEPIMLAGEAPAEAEFVRLEIELSRGAQFDFATPSLR
jgi:hypothetical protein